MKELSLNEQNPIPILHGTLMWDEEWIQFIHIRSASHIKALL